MKKNKVVILFTAVLISVPIISYADEPQGTWAVVDANGLVTNIIVCTESVCGASGSWGGRMPADAPCPGCRLILQVPANPVTGQNQGGYYNPPPQPGEPDRTVHYDDQKQVFTQGTSSAPIVISRNEQEVTIDTVTSLNATILSTQVTFGPNNYQNGQMQMNTIIDSTTGAILSVNQYSRSNLNDSSTATAVFSSPQTQAQVTAAVADKPLISSRLARFFALLKEWMLD